MFKIMQNIKTNGTQDTLMNLKVNLDVHSFSSVFITFICVRLSFNVVLVNSYLLAISISRTPYVTFVTCTVINSTNAYTNGLAHSSIHKY